LYDFALEFFLHIFFILAAVLFNKIWAKMNVDKPQYTHKNIIIDTYLDTSLLVMQTELDESFTESRMVVGTVVAFKV
jgi:uncharacterized protein (DUF983 family)